MEKIISDFILKKKMENDAFTKLLDAMKSQLKEVEKLKGSSLEGTDSSKSEK